MSRLAIVLTALGTVLIVVLWWFLLWSPTSDEIEAVRDQTQQAQDQTQLERTRAAQLRAVRESAPEAEAELSAARVLIPTEGELPALLRQIQQASGDSGVRLSSISPSRPSPVEAESGPLNLTQLSMSVSGTYFQLVDMARRLEDPQITGRGFVWRSVTLSRGEFPQLTASLTAVVYSQGEVEAPPEEPVGEDGTGDEEGVGNPDEEPVDEPVDDEQ